MTRRLLAGAALVLGLLQTASAQNQYSNWLYSGSIYILTTPAGANLAASASETNFPLLVRLSTDFFNFSQAKAGGADVRFATPGGTSLACQIDEWTTTNASIWVCVPNIKGNTNQQIIMYWGKSDATSASSGPAVFSSTNGYVSVMHMTDPTKDEVGSAAPANAGTTAGSGIIGPARHFVAGQGINGGQNITAYPTGDNPHSTEAWFRADAANTTILGWGIEQGQGKVVMQLQSPPHINMDCYFSGGNVTGGSTLALSQWYHVAHTYKSGQARLYVNGVLDGSSSGGSMALPTPVRMYIGGWYDNYTFAGDIDEVRISNVTRSPDWVKMEYQNQNPLQTLAGTLVTAGTNFSVSPTQVTLNEGASTNVTAQAGGAIKVYWILKSGGQQTVVSVDRLAYQIVAGRVSGDQSFVLEFQAVYPTGIKTNDIPVTIKEYLPDPIFTLVASTNLWNGRQILTVTPIISNWSALQAKGVTNLNYHWTVAGVAVTSQTPSGMITPGVYTTPTLTLLRSQGSGPMAVTLVLDNGGTPIANTVTVNVQEPATDPWVVRTPGATEKPVNGQFYARDDTGYGTIYYNGTLSGSPNSVFLKVYTNGPGGDVLYTNVTKSLAGGSYALSARVPAGLVHYKVTFGSTTGGADTVLDTVSDLVCGDAYIIDGQSNAVADNNDPNPTGYPQITYYTNTWIRSHGSIGGGTNGGWGLAVCSSANGDAYRIGYWGMVLASNLVANFSIPICIINGAVGGTRIDQHQPNPANHYLTDSYGNSIYANLLARVAAARLTHGIRGILWHQGENNSAAAAPTGDWDYLSYQAYFVNMSAAWKQDYPNIQYYYIYQIFTDPCSMGGQPASDMLRDVQRTLPYLFSRMSIMETIGGPNYGPGMCHWGILGYTVMAYNMAPLVARDNYGFVPAKVITAPDIKQAYFTTTNHNEITLVFGQDMVWNSASTINFYLDRVGSKVTSGSASGNVIKLQVTGASTNQTIDYVVDQYWNGSTNNLLLGSNGIAALTFYAVPITVPASGSISNNAASGIGSSSAVLNASLSCSGAPFDVRAYWGAANGGTNAAAWTNSTLVGTWNNASSTNISFTATGLIPSRAYYFTFRATSGATDLWAPNVQSFTTLGLPGSGVSLPVALNNSNLVWVTDTNLFWYGQTNVSHDGFASAQSFPIADSQQTPLSASVTGPGTLSFWWKVSSETNADLLQFTTSGSSPACSAQLSGEVDWTQQTFLLPAGQQRLQWVYTKNAGGSAGRDAAWVDQVAYTAGFTLPWILTQPVSQACLVGAPVTFSVSANGTPILAYQWRHDGNPIPGATNTTLAVASAGAPDQGLYSVRITNAYGYMDSADASLAIVLLVSSGDNSFGQLNVAAAAAKPLAVAAGAWHSLALLGDGQVVAWGNDYDGQCDVPASLRDAVAIAGGGYHSLALRLDGQVIAWGANDEGQTAVPPGLANVIAVTAGTWHSLALCADGTVVGWGDDTFGQATPPLELSNVVAIAAGGSHSLALRSDGTVVAWGENTDAVGNYAGQSIVPWGLTNVVAIAAGEYHSLAVRGDGTLALWGDNSQGQCTAPAGLAGIVAVAGGGSHTLALKSDSTVAAWGNNWNGQCSLPLGLSNVVALAAGNSHSLLLEGTPPTAPLPYHPACQGTLFSLITQTAAGRHYALEYKTALSATNWTALPPIYGNGALQFLVDRTAATPRRFYRVRQW